MHPVNIMHMPRPAKESYSENVIIDGLHILYRLLHREIPEIEGNHISGNMYIDINSFME